MPELSGLNAFFDKGIVSSGSSCDSHPDCILSLYIKPEAEQQSKKSQSYTELVCNEQGFSICTEGSFILSHARLALA